MSFKLVTSGKAVSNPTQNMVRKFEILMEVLLNIWVSRDVALRQLLNMYNSYIKELRFFETSVNNYESTRRNILENFNVLQHVFCETWRLQFASSIIV
jgi:hypothetical protein